MPYERRDHRGTIISRRPMLEKPRVEIDDPVVPDVSLARDERPSTNGIV
jgi:hypothetical protein